MGLLVAGLILWSVVHLVPSVGVGLKRKLVTRFGEGAYAGVSALLILCGVGLMVLAWQTMEHKPIYVVPDSFRAITFLLMAVSVMLFVSSVYPTKFRQLVRHPQLTGVIAWSAAHLIQNGDDHAITLFGWLAVWALLEIFFIDRRDGKPSRKFVAMDLILEVGYVAVCVAVFAILLYMHPFISGISII